MDAMVSSSHRYVLGVIYQPCFRVCACINVATCKSVASCFQMTWFIPVLLFGSYSFAIQEKNFWKLYVLKTIHDER